MTEPTTLPHNHPDRPPTVRAEPREGGRTGTFWVYQLYLHDQQVWTSTLRRLEAARVLERYDLTRNQVSNRLQMARRRYEGKVNGTWRGDQRRA